VRRRVPRVTAILAPRKQFLALLLVELTPEIARFGHGGRITVRMNLESLEFRLQAARPGLESRIYAVRVRLGSARGRPSRLKAELHTRTAAPRGFPLDSERLAAHCQFREPTNLSRDYLHFARSFPSGLS
jgi:hypothetical protein